MRTKRLRRNQIRYIGCSEAIRNLDYLARLHEIEVPLLILVGEEDPATPVSTAEAIHERIPHSKLVVIPSARHLSNVEQPAAFTHGILEFLGSSEPRLALPVS